MQQGRSRRRPVLGALAELRPGWVPPIESSSKLEVPLQQGSRRSRWAALKTLDQPWYRIPAIRFESRIQGIVFGSEACLSFSVKKADSTSSKPHVTPLSGGPESYRGVRPSAVICAGTQLWLVPVGRGFGPRCGAVNRHTPRPSAWCAGRAP